MIRFSAIIFLVAWSHFALAADRVTGKMFATRSEVMAPSAMAATSHPLATQIALDIMKNGGNAIDAAIAANAALGLMEPTGNGIGGDLYAIVWDAKSGKLYGLNASGRSPRSLTREWFEQNDFDKIPPFGPLPVSVPGAVDGWFMLHERFGTLPQAVHLLYGVKPVVIAVVLQALVKLGRSAVKTILSTANARSTNACLI